MFKRVLVLCITTIIVVTCLGCSKTLSTSVPPTPSQKVVKDDLGNKDFMNLSWGASHRDMVNKNGTYHKVIDGGYLYNAQKIYDHYTRITYLYNSERLYTGLIEFYDLEYDNVESYFDDFNIILENLIEKYGSNYADKSKWKNEKYKDDPDKLSSAIDDSLVNIVYLWETESTYITLMLLTDDDEPSIAILFESKNIRPTPTPEPTPTPNTPFATMDEYNQVEMGMTLKEVENIFGGRGNIEYSAEINGVVTATISWSKEGDYYSFAMVTFNGGRVVAKSQFGL